MKLEYEQVEESFDDTTHIRTMTEQALMPGRGLLLRTTVYTPHHISINVAFVPGSGNQSEGFESVSP
jgi:hypothetical protein